MSVVEQLQKTPKGQLRYDRHRLCMQSIEGVLGEIQAEMSAMQVPVSPPSRFSSPPSFGLAPDSDSDDALTPLVRKTERMTERRRPATGGQTAAGPTGRDRSTPARAGTSPPARAGTSWTGRGGTNSSASSAPGSVDRGQDSSGGIGGTAGGAARSPGAPAAGLTETPTGRRPAASLKPSTTSGVDRGEAPRARSAERSGAAPGDSSERRGDGEGDGGPATSTPRAGQRPAAFTPRTFEKKLHDLRQQHLQEAKEAARARLAEVEATLAQLRQQYVQREQQLAAQQRQRRAQQDAQLHSWRRSSEQQLEREREIIRQRKERDAKEISDRVQAAVQKQKADEEERRRQAGERRALLDQMAAAQKQFSAAFMQVVTAIKSCSEPRRLQAGPAAGQLERLRRLQAGLERLVTGAAAASADQLRDSVAEAERLVAEAAELGSSLQQSVEEVNAAGAKKEEAAKPAPVAPPTPPAAAPPQPARPAQTTAAAVPTAAVSSEVALPESRARYEGLQQRAAEFRAGFAALLADPQLKKFKFDCQKAVNTPINAISPVSAVHLRDKLGKLQRLLRGQPVAVAGQSQVSAAAHPRGVHFCLDLVAKKFVRQGEDVVSSKPEAAFALASVLCGLQREFPDLTELTLAHLQARCPYLVPLYPPQLDGDTDEQYYRKLGYDYVDGAVEKQDKFLKRMSGIARLYAALLVARPPQSAPAAAAGTPQLSVRDAWSWMTSVVNLDPRPDITASLLFDVIEVAGSTLSAAYGKQFAKLVRVISAQYLPRIQQVTPEGCGGPVVRLEQQLKKIIASGRVPPPAGELKLYGW